ncbi:MAG: hypothetical protein EP336_16430 [Rhodobacteraceae bacterium]|nr:MAG: hypothetical protein EP336_16430 [Paracoccaceae bacterium]
MSKLIAAFIGVLLSAQAATAEFSLDKMPDFPQFDPPAFDPEKFFCEQGSPDPKTYEDAFAWLRFIRGLMIGEISSEVANCYTTRNFSLKERVLQEPNDESARLNLIVATSIELSGRDTYDLPPEERFANDAIALGYMYLGCKRFADDMLGCFQKVTEQHSVPIIQNSPIFCDFSENYDTQTTDLTGYQHDIDILRELPGSCSGIINPQLTEAQQRKDDWWHRLDGFMSVSSAE